MGSEAAFEKHALNFVGIPRKGEGSTVGLLSAGEASLAHGDPPHSLAPKRYKKLARTPAATTRELLFTLMAPLMLHSEDVQHFMEKATRPRSRPPCGQDAAQSLLMDCLWLSAERKMRMDP